MGTEFEVIEQRLKSFMGQLKTEFGILDRIVYKNKNQHRRSSYFQFVLKVRRDLRLLQSANLDEILSSCFLVINGNRPKQKVQLLESLKRRRSDGGKHNFLERLLGVARLLSQMVEPMLKAAVEISKLLAQSFFMGLSLTILALLARFRVLIQQILLDVVCAYNAVSSLSQKKQAIKISEGGVQVFREYYPIKDQPSIHLECIWKTDKYVLIEKINGGQTETQPMEIGEAVSSGASEVRYESMEVLLGDNEPGTVAPNRAALAGAEDGKPDSDLLANPLPQCNEGKKVKESSPAAVSLPLPLSPSCSKATEGGSVETSSSSLQPNNPLKRKHPSKGKVAFVSIKEPAATSGADKLNSSSIKGTEKVDEKKEDEDPFFSMLTAGNMNKSSIL